MTEFVIDTVDVRLCAPSLAEPATLKVDDRPPYQGEPPHSSGDRDPIGSPLEIAALEALWNDTQIADPTPRFLSVAHLAQPDGAVH